MSKHLRILLVAVGFLLVSGIVFAQSSSVPQPSVSATPAETSATAPREHHHTEYVSPGDKPVENADEEENSQFKYSSIVRGLAVKTGLSKQAVYWIFTVINFLILAAGGVWVVRKVMPNGFAPRTAEIQKAIEEARKASAEAGARLTEIEGRLSRLDTEIAGIRSSAESDFGAEEQRIKADAENDARLVIVAAEQEIAAAARTAQRDLKAFVAGLAVDLAEKKIKVDDATDHALVRDFAAQLGKDGQ
jgi:F-type H+-transporting ATPase subunit b